jgi:hypothetical protein
VAVRPRRTPLIPLVILVVLVAIAAYLAQASRTAANPEWLRLAAGLCAGGALAVLLLGIWRRR